MIDAAFQNRIAAPFWSPVFVDQCDPSHDALPDWPRDPTDRHVPPIFVMPNSRRRSDGEA